MTNKHEVLKRILHAAAIDTSACAAALNISDEVLSDMLAGQRTLPEGLVPLTAAVLGVRDALLSANEPVHSADPVPAIWYKLRSEELTHADREYVLAIRQLAFYNHELELLTDSRSVAWKSLFDSVRKEVDPQASPSEQGRQAARIFRKCSGLASGARGIGEVLRGCLRNNGILVIETTARDSVLDGCSFFVGPAGEERPCIFANSYRTTWFRRNQILMHEVAHAIFDVDSSIASLDIRESRPSENIQEIRADSFAQEVLVPNEVLRNLVTRHKIVLDRISVIDLAVLVAQAHVEQRLIVKALSESGLITTDEATGLLAMDIASELRNLSTHALSTSEYLKKAPQVEGGYPRRTTTTAPRKLLLPVRYVVAVLHALKGRMISAGKAARMLMIDEFELFERFPAVELEYAD